MARKRRKKASRRFFGAGIHRPRMTASAHTFHLRPHSPYKGTMHRVNRRRRHNPMLAEYLLGNPHRRGHRRRRHNPDFGVKTLTNPMPLLIDAGSGLVGVATPIIVGNLLTGFIAPTLPMLTQPGIVGSALRAAIRVAAAMGIDMVLPAGGLAMFDKNAFRVGEAIGIGGSFIMDLLGRPLLIGPGDTALSVNYLFGGIAPGVAGQGAYFRRGVTGQGAYFRRSMTGHVGDTGALVPLPRAGVRGTGAFAPKVDLFSPF